MRTKVVPASRGVVLVDVIVGTVILGVAFAVLIGVLGRVIDAQADGERMQAAAMLVDEQLNLVLARGAENYAQRFPVEGVCEAPFESYRFQLAIVGGTGSQPYEVTATVRWWSRIGERSASAGTLVAPRLGDDPDPVRSLDAPVERPQ